MFRGGGSGVKALMKAGTSSLVPALFGDKSGALVNALSSASGLKSPVGNQPRRHGRSDCAHVAQEAHRREGTRMRARCPRCSPARVPTSKARSTAGSPGRWASRVQPRSWAASAAQRRTQPAGPAPRSRAARPLRAAPASPRAARLPPRANQVCSACCRG